MGITLLSRPRVRPRRSHLLRRSLVALAAAAISFVTIAAIHRTLRSELPGAAAAWAHERTLALTASVGLVLREIEVTGNREVARASVLAALGAEQGQPILALDLKAAQARLESDGWVKRATIQRRLPDTIAVTIEERTPAALWQHDGRFAVIDRDGAVIARDRLGRFPDLPQLVGADAPRHAAVLLDALDAEPKIAGRLKAAARVAGRRWSLHFEDGLEVMLPSDDVEGAIKRLARMDRDGELFARNLRVVDLRAADRAFVRLSPRPALSTTGRL